MKRAWILFAELIPLTLFSYDVNQYRLIKIDQIFEDRYHLRSVMAIYRPKIPEPHLLEQHARNEQVLQAFLQLSRGPVRPETKTRYSLQYPFHIVAYLIISRICNYSVQIPA